MDELCAALENGASWVACAELLEYSGAEALLNRLANKPVWNKRARAARQRSLIEVLGKMRRGDATEIQHRWFRRVARDTSYADIDNVVRAGAIERAAAAGAPQPIEIDILLDEGEAVEDEDDAPQD